MTTLATPPPAGTRRRAYAPRPWPADHPPWRALDDQLAPDHLARRVDQAVAQLDLHPLEAAYGRTGSPPHEPADWRRVVLVEVERGQHRPAVWWRDRQEAGPVRWLLRGAVPSRSCWYAVRQRLGAVLEELNRQVLHQAVADELTPAGRGALDGTLVAANASRHRLVNAATLTKRLAPLAAALTPAADPADPAADLPAAVADGRPPGRPVADGTAAAAVAPPGGETSTGPPPGPPKPPGWMAPTPTGPQHQQPRWQQAQQQRAARQQRHQAKPTDKRTPPDQLVISRSDPEAALGRDNQGVFRPLDNVHILDDLDTPFILSDGVFAQSQDAGRLGPMRHRQQTLVGRRVQDLLADAS